MIWFERSVETNGEAEQDSKQKSNIIIYTFKKIMEKRKMTISCGVEEV